MRLAVLLLITTAAQASAQVVAWSGADAGLGFGSGAGRVLFVHGRAVAFFTVAGEVRFVDTVDGQRFRGPFRVGPGARASEGFATAVTGARVGLAWGDSDGGAWALRYAEAVDDGGVLAFGPPAVVSSAAEPRGLRPALTFSAAGEPVILSLDYNHPYVGPISGCGPARTWRSAPYYRLGGAWQHLGYCNDFSSGPPASAWTSVSALGNGTVIHASARAGNANLNTGIFDPALPPASAELGEPWSVRADLATDLSDGLASVPSVTSATEAHHVYLATPGGVTYTRQDGLAIGNGATGLDVTVISAAGTSPAMARPAAATGCYAIAWVEGNEIRVRTFRDTIGTLTPARTAFTRPQAPSLLSLSQQGVNPVATWLEGSTVYFGAVGAVAPTVTVVPSSAPADGRATVTVTAGPFLDACGSPVPEGTLITVSVSAGTVLDADGSTSEPGVQLGTRADGTVEFQVQAPAAPTVASLVAAPTEGGAFASSAVSFVAMVDGGTELDGGEAGLDGGGTELDGGEAVDGGAERDAGVVVDGGDGAPHDPRHLGVGCGCGSVPASAGALVAVVGLTRRRRAAGWHRKG